MAENLLLYSSVLRLLLPRLLRMDLTSTKNAYLLFRCIVKIDCGLFSYFIIQGGFFDCSALKMTKCQRLKEISELFLPKND